MDQEARKTVFYSWHKSHGGKMVNYAGWEMPLNYAQGILEEHLATRKFGGLFDITHMGRFLISGEGTLPFLQYVLTNNAAALEAGQAQYTLIANENGGAIDDAYLYRLEEKEYLLVVNAANAAKDWAWFQEHCKKFPHLHLEEMTEKIAMLALQGPRSKATLKKLLRETRCSLPDPGRNNLRSASIEGIQGTVARTGYTGEPLAFELFFPADKALIIWGKILQAGKDEGIVPVGLGARDTLRLEAGLPLHGHELGFDRDGREMPIFAVHSAKIGVSFSPVKGDFIGKEALAKQFQEIKLWKEGRKETSPGQSSVPRMVFPVAILRDGVARQHFPVYIEDLPVGFVTSGTMVPFWRFEGQGLSSTMGQQVGRRAIALAYLDAHLKEGQAVKISSRGKFLAGLVVKAHLSAEAPPFSRPIHIEEPVPRIVKPAKPLESSVQTLVKRTKDNARWRQGQAINLIPSEHTPSPLVKLLSIADPSGRYAEHRHLKPLGDESVYYYQGTDFIQGVEERLSGEMQKYLGCSHVETRVISGQMANAAVYSALVDYLNRFDRKSTPRRLRKVMNHHLGRGGHLSSQPMGSLRDFLAIDPRTDKPGAINFPVLEENPYQIDLMRTERLLHEHQPQLIILGKSMMLHREPLAELCRIVEGMREKPLIMYDMAHVLGLIGPHFQQPFKEGADVVTGSTHKTFFGTQRGIIASNFEEGYETHDLWRAIAHRTFPGSLSNHHLGTLLGLLLAAYEMNAFAREYQRQIIANAKAFARALKGCGLQVEGDPRFDYTETHQVVLRVGYARGPEIAQRLERDNIIVNYQALPDDEGFTASSGLRMGVQEMTRFGMKEENFAELAGIMAEIILKDRRAAEQVTGLRSHFLQMQYCLPEEKARPLIGELLEVVIG